MCMFLLLFLSLLGKGCFRFMNFLSSCVLVGRLRSRLGGASRCGGKSGINVGRFFLLVDLVGLLVDLLVHLFSWLKCMNNIALLDLRILNFISLNWTSGWLGKVPFDFSLRELANWLIRISNLDMACEWLLNVCPWFYMKAVWDFIKVSILSSNLLNFFLHWWTLEGGRWSLTGKICLMIGMVKFIGKIWPGRIVLCTREVWVISPTGIVCLWVRIVLLPWVGAFMCSGGTWWV